MKPPCSLSAADTCIFAGMPGCSFKGLLIYFLCSLSAVRCRSQIFGEGSTGPCLAGKQEGYLQEPQDFMALPTGMVFRLPLAGLAQRTYSDISRKNKTHIPCEPYGKDAHIQHKSCRTHPISKEWLCLQCGFIFQPMMLETVFVQMHLPHGFAFRSGPSFGRCLLGLPSECTQPSPWCELIHQNRHFAH